MGSNRSIRFAMDHHKCPRSGPDGSTGPFQLSSKTGGRIPRSMKGARHGRTAAAIFVARWCPFLEKWDGSLAIQPRWAAMNKCLAQSNKSRAGGKAT